VSAGGPDQARPFQELVRRRFSLRRYDAGRPVAREDLEAILEAARLAPSAENSQPWRFLVVTDPGVRARLAEACFTGIFLPTRFAAAAPVIIAICAERAKPILRAGEAILRTALYQLDCGIAGEHAALAAAELGLGSCWIGWFNKRGARKVLGIPGHVEVLALLSVGYPAAEAGHREKPRRSLAAITHRDRWGTPFVSPPAGAGGSPAAEEDTRRS
jgi:nitroreductase